MPVMIKIVGTASETFPHSGPPLLLSAFDADARNGFGSVKLTNDEGEAMKFPDQEAAHAFWRTESTVRPVRQDGKPNRPLTAFTIEIIPAP